MPPEMQLVKERQTPSGLGRPIILEALGAACVAAPIHAILITDRNQAV